MLCKKKRRRRAEQGEAGYNKRMKTPSFLAWLPLSLQERLYRGASLALSGVDRARKPLFFALASAFALAMALAMVAALTVALAGVGGGGSPGSAARAFLPGWWLAWTADALAMAPAGVWRFPGVVALFMLFAVAVSLAVIACAQAASVVFKGASAGAAITEGKASALGAKARALSEAQEIEAVAARPGAGGAAQRRASRL